VLPLSRKGRPDEKPSMSITATFGCRSDVRTDRRITGFYWRFFD
jgi:hypothetical protein